ncbi:MAG TPA: hypothetical protein VFO29_02840 [Candidatus Rubrimentiphilum sp.]|nr:hypothetical protein [Candidatus Rubrimentiphilum sp.]
MTNVRPYGTLSTLLYALSVLEALAGLILLFATNWALSLVPANLALGDSDFVMIFFKAIGIVALALGYLLCVAARDPVRYLAIIDTLIALLVASAILNVFALTAMHLGKYYPANYMLVRIVVQLVLAAAVFALRPKTAKA